MNTSRQDIKKVKLKAIHRQDEMAKLRTEMSRLITVLRKHGVSLDQEVVLFLSKYRKTPLLIEIK